MRAEQKVKVMKISETFENVGNVQYERVREIRENLLTDETSETDAEHLVIDFYNSGNAEEIKANVADLMEYLEIDNMVKENSNIYLYYKGKMGKTQVSIDFWVPGTDEEKIATLSEIMGCKMILTKKRYTNKSISCINRV